MNQEAKAGRALFNKARRAIAIDRRGEIFQMMGVNVPPNARSINFETAEKPDGEKTFITFTSRREKLLHNGSDVISEGQKAYLKRKHIASRLPDRV